jgi:hypothetical protein
MWMIRDPRLSIGVGLLMLVQSTMGLLLPGQYRDVVWIKTTWFGNDWVTLIVAIPLLFVGLEGSARGSVRGLLLRLGIMGYAAYNYAFYLFGAALNSFFLLYVAAVGLAAVTLIGALAHLDVVRVSQSFRPRTPVRIMGGALVLIGVGLAAAWIAMWAAYVFTGRSTPVEPEAFKVVAALDLAVMVPALTMGGILLWRRHAWGYVLASMASIQSAMYLLVLSVNSMVAIQRRLVAAPGELPIWGTLMALTTAVAVAVLASVRREGASPSDRRLPSIQGHA